MQLQRSISFVTITLLLVCFSAPAQTAKPDNGLVKDGSYYNLFFGFGFTYPKDWVVHEQAVNDRIHEKAKEEGAKTGILQQVNNTHLLLTVTRHPKGTPNVAVNSAVLVAAERIDFWPGKPGAKDYLMSLRTSKAKRGIQAVLNEPAEFKVAGFQFLRDDYRGEVNGVSMRQSIFVTAKKGFVVIFSFTGEDEKNVAEMAQTMNTILPLASGGGDRPLSPERKP